MNAVMQQVLVSKDARSAAGLSSAVATGADVGGPWA